MEEECEADPLVILVVLLLLVAGGCHARVSHLGPDLVLSSVGDCEGGVDPAVSVHDVLRNVWVHYAVNRIADVLSRGHQET